MNRTMLECYTNFAMTTDLITIRTAEPDDALALAEIYEESWRLAYQGILPHIALERLIAKRGPGWWQWSARRGRKNLLVLDFDGQACGYANLGRNRTSSLPYGGEIHELYIKPTYQGIGFGRQLFEASYHTLKTRDILGLVVWALAENRSACDFYKHMGGEIVTWDNTNFGKEELKRIAFGWPST